MVADVRPHQSVFDAPNVGPTGSMIYCSNNPIGMIHDSWIGVESEVFLLGGGKWGNWRRVQQNIQTAAFDHVFLIVGGKHGIAKLKLFVVGHAKSALRLGFGFGKGWQQHASQD